MFKDAFTFENYLNILPQDKHFLSRADLIPRLASGKRKWKTREVTRSLRSITGYPISVVAPMNRFW